MYEDKKRKGFVTKCSFNGKRAFKFMMAKCKEDDHQFIFERHIEAKHDHSHQRVEKEYAVYFALQKVSVEDRNVDL